MISLPLILLHEWQRPGLLLYGLQLLPLGMHRSVLI